MKSTQLILFFLFLLVLTACEKEPVSISPFDMLAGKKWYLEQRFVKSSSDSVRYSFIGLPTFWFRLKTDSSYMDSDGYIGRYLVEQSADTLLLIVTELNRGTAKSYRVNYLGFNYLIVEYNMNQNLTRLYFSSRL